MAKVFRIWMSQEDINPSTEARLNFIISVSYLFLAIPVIYFVNNAEMGITQVSNIGQFLAAIFTLISIRLFHSYFITANICSGTILMSLVFTLATFHEFPYTILIWSPVFTITVVYLLGVKGGMVWTLVGCTTISGVVLLPSTELAVSAQEIAAIDFRIVACMTVVMTMIGAYIASALFNRHISQLTKRLSESNGKLLLQTELLRDALAEKQTLVSIVCHDIANPLTVVNYQLLKMNRHEPVKQEVQKVQKAITMISDIIDNVRIYQALQMGKSNLKLTSISLKEVLDDCIFVFQSRLNDKNVNIDIKGELQEAYILADRSSIGNSVINNIISNAIKFSERGGTIEITIQNESDDCLVLKIQDFGVGMSPDTARDLFKSNVKTTNKGTAGESGTGFGMPITHAIMSKIGGSIAVDSNSKILSPHNHGTTFILRFKRGKPTVTTTTMQSA